jgi:twinkle protein
MKNYSLGFEQLNIDTDKAKGRKCRCPKCDEAKRRPNDYPLFIDKTSGNYSCHRCGYKGRADSNEWIMSRSQKQFDKKHTIHITDQEMKTIKAYSEAKKTFDPFPTQPVNDQGLAYMKSRGISENSVRRAKMAQKTIYGKYSLAFVYYLDGIAVNAKYRNIETKTFLQHKNAPNRALWGIDNVKDSKKVIICEGEIDVLSFYEIGEYSAVSISQGAPNKGSNIGSKLKCLDNCAELLKDKEIIIAVDNDENGLYLQQTLVNRFGKDKCRIMEYPQGCKDANDTLLIGPEVLKECLRRAEYTPIEGIITVDDVRAKMKEIRKNGVQKGISTGVPCLDGHFSFYPGWWNLFTGIPNSGKSEFVLFLMLCMSIKHGFKWAVFSPEHWPAEDFYTDVIEKFCGNRLSHIESDKDYDLMLDFVNDHFFFVYHDDNDEEQHDAKDAGYTKKTVNTRTNIIESIKELSVSKGINGFLIDPYNQMVKDPTDPKGERTDQELERSLGQIDRLCKTHNLCGNVVAHPRTMYKDRSEADYKCPTAYEISGGAMWYNKAYVVAAIHRPTNQSNKENPAIVFSVQKVKSHKRTGSPADINMNFSHGWYVGEFEQRNQCVLEGAFDRYKQDLIEEAKGKQLEFIHEDEIPF